MKKGTGQKPVPKFINRLVGYDGSSRFITTLSDERLLWGAAKSKSRSVRREGRSPERRQAL
jgi:hypothetical protein